MNDRNESRARYYAHDIEWAMLRHMHGGDNGIELPSDYATRVLYRRHLEPKEPTAKEIINDLINELGG